MNNYFSTIEVAAKLNTSPLFSFGYLMQILFSLIIVFGLLYVTSKYLLPKLQTSSSGKLIKVIERVSLEPQVSSYIIKVGDSSWLIIVSNKCATKIEKLESLPQI